MNVHDRRIQGRRLLRKLKLTSLYDNNLPSLSVYLVFLLLYCQTSLVVLLVALHLVRLWQI